MGDLPPGSVPTPLDPTAIDQHQNGPAPTSLHIRPSSHNVPFHSQLSPVSQGQVRGDMRSPTHSTPSHYPAHEHGASPLNMGLMAGALPEYGTLDSGPGNPQVPQSGQRPLSGASTSALVYQLQQNLQMPGHAPGSHSGYGPGFVPGQYQQNVMPSQGYPGAQHRLPGGPTSMAGPYQNYPQPQQYMYYPAPYGHQGPYPSGFPAQSPQGQQQQQAMFGGRRPSLNNTPMGVPGQGMDTTGLHTEPNVMSPGFGHSFGQGSGAHRHGTVSSIPRGPPRKPKQSGHALWVGNLPPGTTVVALKDHFSRDATKDIQSLFLISKSNCAFVNYRTEASCTAAMHRFHDSRFNGVRLVCRLRRSSTPASGVPTGPSAMVGSQPLHTSPPESPLPEAEAVEEQEEVPTVSPTRKSGEEDGPLPPAATTASEKYFIVKSLTLQDLESSVRNGIWATQSHNEEALNKAYNSADNVFLIFSANKSGEYFGYARMASPILEDASHLMASFPKPDNVLDSPDVPKSIPTPATEFAPKGRIIDDSARGTIFWEAELTESEGEDENTEKGDPQLESDQSAVAQSWGKPFKVEWISTNRLPFYRTRGLRNPWNANREVKIARDGTELEPSVGERLVQMFHRLGPSSAAAPMMPPPQLGGPHMRQF